MGLWIRSQDRLTLTKVSNLYIPMSRTEEIWCIKENELYLGFYKTKERALEVLDEIQDYIEKQGVRELITNDRGIIEGSKYYGKVYNMPKE